MITHTNYNGSGGAWPLARSRRYCSTAEVPSATTGECVGTTLAQVVLHHLIAHTCISNHGLRHRPIIHPAVIDALIAVGLTKDACVGVQHEGRQAASKEGEAIRKG